LTRVAATALALAAIGFAAISMATTSAEAQWPSEIKKYKYSCFAGCCSECSFGLCCFNEPPIPGDPWPEPQR
jgi:hypothetical protein